MRKRKEDQQKFLSDSKSSDHLHHPHYRRTMSTHSTCDGKNHFETQRINRKTQSIKVLSAYNRFGDQTIHKFKKMD